MTETAPVRRVAVALFEGFTVLDVYGPVQAFASSRIVGPDGKLRFHTEDIFVDAAAGKALIRWLCTLETKRGPSAWRGLDILHVENGRITEKLTYAKAKVPLLGETP